MFLNRNRRNLALKKRKTNPVHVRKEGFDFSGRDGKILRGFLQDLALNGVGIDETYRIIKEWIMKKVIGCGA